MSLFRKRAAGGFEDAVAAFLLARRTAFVRAKRHRPCYQSGPTGGSPIVEPFWR